MPAKAYGRSLSDFGKLLPAEEILREACRLGEWAIVGDERPNPMRAICTPQNHGETPGEIFAHAAERHATLKARSEAWRKSEDALERLRDAEWAKPHLFKRKAEKDERKAEQDVWVATVQLSVVLNLPVRYVRSLQFIRTKPRQNRRGWTVPYDGADQQLTPKEARNWLRQIRIRPTVLRFFILGGDDTAPVHEQGVRVEGAWIDGGLDLRGCRTTVLVYVFQCRIDGAVSAYDRRLATLNLRGTAVSGLAADGLECDGDVFLREGFHASGEVRLPGAQIGGNLECSGGRFDNAGGHALVCDGMTTGGRVFLRAGFHASGAVRLPGAQIGGDLSCSGGRFDNAGGYALLCDRMTTGADVVLIDGFHASGEVRLPGAQIGGDLACDGGRFENPPGHALFADGTTVVGSLFSDRSRPWLELWIWLPVRLGRWSTMRRVGGSATAICSITSATGGWRGTTYECAHAHRLAEGSGARSRRVRLSPAAWEHLAKVLREMGHDEEARKIAIAKQERMYAVGRIKGIAARPLHWLYGLLAGYGYRPLTAICWMLGVCVLWAVLYCFAGLQGWFAPTNPLIHNNADIIAGCQKEAGGRQFNWTTCSAVPPAYTTFQPLIYSADLILPLVDLQQENEWAPMVVQSDGRSSLWGGICVRWLMWIEILFGWGMSLLLVAVLGNLVKKDLVAAERPACAVSPP